MLEYTYDGVKQLSSYLFFNVEHWTSESQRKKLYSSCGMFSLRSLQKE